MRQSHEALLATRRAYYKRNIERIRQLDRERYVRDRDKHLAAKRLAYEANKGLYSRRSAQWYAHNKEYWKAKMKEARRLLKLAAFEAYGGPFCSCCGETELIFLSMDHMNGRKEHGHKGMGSKDLYLWLANHDYPDGFQVLCFNCNHGRFLNGGICPHKEHGK